jgi:serine/threonine protein kinase
MSDRRNRFQRVEAIFLAAKRLPEHDRDAFVAEQAGDDHDMANEVRALLEEDARSLGALDRPPLGRADLEALTREVREAPLPARIGRFRVNGLLGVGGMGAVYEAEQDEPRRLVALKVIRPGLITPALLRRFRRETNALAQLSHPGIARIYEAGAATTESGETPYFAMELIRGRPLVDFANANALDTRRRLSLVADVADALHHAHQHGVVHRDLKPANILVDESGKPRILDFGVSSVAHEPGDDSALNTESGVLLGTLAYMSPEQASGDTSRVDHRSDVYSLGVIAYELLAGAPPYEIRRDAIHEAARIIREVEPTSLSSMNRALRGDAETIVFKAISKEPDRRYQTAAEFAGDIRRFLANEPILARRPSASYQLAKFARRNRPLVAGVAAAFVVLLASLLVISGLLVRTMRAERNALLERDEAALQAAIAEEINDFLVLDLIAAVSPENTQDRDVTLLDLLDAASESVENHEFDHPEVEAEIRHTIARTYFELGRPDDALPHALRAGELGLGAFGPGHGSTQEYYNTIAHIHRFSGRFEEAAPYYEQVLEGRRANPDTEPAMLVVALSNLAGLYRSMGRTPEAFALLEESIAIAERSLEPTSNQRLSAQSTLAGAYREEGRYEEAVALYEEVFAITERAFPPDHPRVFREMNSLAIVYARLERYNEAEALYRRSLDGQRALFGPDHLQTLITQSNYASMLNDSRRYDEARTMLVDCVDRYNATLGAGHPAALAAAFNLAKVHDSLGDHAAAVEVMIGVVERSREVYGDEHHRVLVAVNQLIRSRLLAKDTEGLAETTAQFIDDARRILPPDHPYFAIYLITSAEVQEHFGEHAGALSTLREAGEILGRIESGAYDRERASVIHSIERIESIAGAS